jgi:hypothetical protein
MSVHELLKCYMMMILSCAAVYIADTLLHMQYCAVWYTACIVYRQALPVSGASVFFGTMPNEGDSSSTAAAATNNSNSSSSSSDSSIVADQQQADATGADATTVVQVRWSALMSQVCVWAATACALSCAC